MITFRIITPPLEYPLWQALLAWSVSAADGFVSIVELDDVVVGYAGDEAAGGNVEYFCLAIADVVELVLIGTADGSCGMA